MKLLCHFNWHSLAQFTQHQFHIISVPNCYSSNFLSFPLTSFHQKWAEMAARPQLSHPTLIRTPVGLVKRVLLFLLWRPPDTEIRVDEIRFRHINQLFLRVSQFTFPCFALLWLPPHSLQLNSGSRLFSNPNCFVKRKRVQNKRRRKRK